MTFHDLSVLVLALERDVKDLKLPGAILIDLLHILDFSKVAVKSFIVISCYVHSQLRVLFGELQKLVVAQGRKILFVGDYCGHLDPIVVSLAHMLLADGL